MESGTATVKIRKVRDENSDLESDLLAVEEPLEIRLRYSRAGQLVQRSISVTMRTPGHDEELAAGFLHTENIVSGPDQIESIGPAEPEDGQPAPANVIVVTLRPDIAVDLKRLERHFYTTSSCGVCGKASLEALKLGSVPPIPEASPVLSAAAIHSLPGILRQQQDVFDSTGGLHASALFDSACNLITLREDIGRHNALDKLIGHRLLNRQLPLSGHILLVSGRTSFEIMQKALAAGIPFIAGVGAPSSLAVEVANSFNVTLLGFVRDNRFNIYSGAQRVS